jgi:hypothetical protein
MIITIKQLKLEQSVENYLVLEAEAFCYFMLIRKKEKMLLMIYQIFFT